nr:LOW QUALITY PROTEIN: arylacetamide deacetylase-like [Equus asinus]
MGRKTILLLTMGILGAYYVYTPLPDNIEEPWRLVWVDTVSRSIRNLGLFVELLGITHFMNVITFFMWFQEVPPTSDENVTVTDTSFNNVPVRIYDLLSRRTADRLDAVVISTNYRLAPKHHFPNQFEDVYNATRWFLRQDVLDECGVDPERVGISGTSSGGNLAAAVAQQLLDDPDVKIKLRTQSLMYPALQSLDMDLPSYRENAHFPPLSRSFGVRILSEYFTTDRSLEKAMLFNQHVPVESSHLFQYVNWSSLLPEKFKKGQFYNSPTLGSSQLAKKYPGFLDVRASPLLADDRKLHRLPLTYIITCQHDVLRDDGFMYASRLRNAGVRVTHNHVEDGFHRILSYHEFKIGHRTQNQYLNWLSENL